APASRELLAQFHVVVDLAVLRHGDAAGVYRDRLMAAGEIDDAQTRGADRRRILREVPLIIRPAVIQRPHHADQPPGVCRMTGQRDEASDAAHDDGAREIPAASASSSATYIATRSAARPSTN